MVARPPRDEAGMNRPTEVWANGVIDDSKSDNIDILVLTSY